MSSGMNLEEAKEYAKTMTYSEAVSNVKYSKGIKYRKATMIKLRELAEIADRLDKENRQQGEWIAEYKTVEVKRGQHLGTSFRQVGWSCSNCGGGVDKAYSNCPYCLSKMTIYNSMKGANNGY